MVAKGNQGNRRQDVNHTDMRDSGNDDTLVTNSFSFVDHRMQI